jgi:hypothetical protein
MAYWPRCWRSFLMKMSAEAMRCSSGFGALMLYRLTLVGLHKGFDLWKEQNGLLIGHLDAGRSDAVLDGFQRWHVHLHGEDFIGPLEEVDGVDEVDAQVVDVDELIVDIESGETVPMLFWAARMAHGMGITLTEFVEKLEASQD